MHLAGIARRIGPPPPEYRPLWGVGHGSAGDLAVENFLRGHWLAICVLCLDWQPQRRATADMLAKHHAWDYDTEGALEPRDESQHPPSPAPASSAAAANPSPEAAPASSAAAAKSSHESAPASSAAAASAVDVAVAPYSIVLAAKRLNQLLVPSFPTTRGIAVVCRLSWLGFC